MEPCFVVEPWRTSEKNETMHGSLEKKHQTNIESEKVKMDSLAGLLARNQGSFKGGLRCT